MNSTTPVVTITRTTSRSDGVFSTLAVNNFPIAVCLERPWLDNAKSVSCIPSGSYVAKRVISPKFGDVFQVMEVPNRDHILIHSGNIDDDSHGCILVGESFTVWKDGSCSVASSKAAMEEFMKLLAGVSSFQLVIKDCYL